MTTQDIIDELSRRLTAHRVKEFIEGNPKFLPHEVKDILYMVYKYGFEESQYEGDGDILTEEGKG